MEQLLNCQNLTKRYGYKTALDNIDLSLERGRIIGLLGPNGSGKTTLLKISAGLLQATTGQVWIDGQEPGPYTKAVTAFLPDRMALPTEYRVQDAVAFYLDFFSDFDTAKVHAMLADLKLEPGQRIGAMSKGTQEKLQLCLTMGRQARLYLLDEPLGGVDPAAREYILRTILCNYNEDAAVVISTHLIEDVETALDEVLLLKDGALLAHQNVDELREESGKSLDEYFREAFRC